MELINTTKVIPMPYSQLNTLMAVSVFGRITKSVFWAYFQIILLPPGACMHDEFPCASVSVRVTMLAATYLIYKLKTRCR